MKKFFEFPENYECPGQMELEDYLESLDEEMRDDNLEKQIKRVSQ